MKNHHNEKPKSYEIVGKTEAAPQTYIFTLKGRLDFDPGKFVQISLPHYGEATFAPCSNPEDKKKFDITIRDAGSTTKALTKLEIGDEMLVRGPYGNGWPLGKLVEQNVVIIAGGMGIVPTRPLLYLLEKYKKHYKKVHLFLGAKTPHHLLFTEDLERWKKKFDLVKVAVEKGDSSWWGDTCMITDIMQKAKMIKNSKVVMCGPDVMFKFCNQVLFKKGIDEKNVFVSLERRMECGVGICQHCNVGKYLVCKDGPVFSWDQIKGELGK